MRELKNNVSEILRQAEAGEEFIVTNQGRKVAELGPHRPGHWRSWNEVSEIFQGPADADFFTDINQLGTVELEDPFTP